MALRQSWTYMLRIPGGSPDTLRMDRLGEYLKLFADLLGVENKPVFKGIKNASIGLRAQVPMKRRDASWRRIQDAKYKPDSRAAAPMRKLEAMLGEDSFRSAELKDHADNVVMLFKAKQSPLMQRMSIRQHGEVDGVVTGLVGADDTMHLHLRDIHARDIKLIVRDEEMARGLLAQFRKGVVRVKVHGHWTQTEDGWVPDNNRCSVDGFSVLDDEPIESIMAKFGAIPGNGWCELDDPYAYWADIRGGN